MRVEEDGKTHVPLRHGKVIEHSFVKLIERLELRRLLVLILRGMSLTFYGA
jgi:hypothetical protein